MSLTIEQLIELENGVIRTLQGGRMERVLDSSLIWRPFKHGTVGIYNGDLWVPITPEPADYPSLSNVATDIDGATMSGGRNYDVFAEYHTEDTFNLVSAEWSDDNTRKYDIEQFQGVYVQENTTTSGQCRRYLGTIRLNDDGNYQDDQRRRFVVNWDNWVVKHVRIRCNTNSNWSSNTGGSWVEFRNGSNVERGEFLCVHQGVAYGGAVVIYGNHRQSYDDRNSRISTAMNKTNGRSNGCEGRLHATHDCPCESMVGLGNDTPNLGYNYVTMVYRSWIARNEYCESGNYDGGAWMIQA